jgi:hypothetical protein
MGWVCLTNGAVNTAPFALSAVLYLTKKSGQNWRFVSNVCSRVDEFVRDISRGDAKAKMLIVSLFFRLYW